MNKIREERSLLEVRKWKEQCRLEDQNLSPKEYLKKLRAISEKIKAQHNICLERVFLLPAESTGA